MVTDKYPIPNLKFHKREKKIDYYILVEDYCVEIAGIEVCVEKGFITDGQSVPWYAWWFAGVPQDSRVLPAAVIHDWFCEEAKKTKCWELRNIGDAVFRFILREMNEVKYWRAVCMYWAVWVQGNTTLRVPSIRKLVARLGQRYRK